MLEKGEDGKYIAMTREKMIADINEELRKMETTSLAMISKIGMVEIVNEMIEKRKADVTSNVARINKRLGEIKIDDVDLEVKWREIYKLTRETQFTGERMDVIYIGEQSQIEDAVYKVGVTSNWKITEIMSEIKIIYMKQLEHHIMKDVKICVHDMLNNRRINMPEGIFERQSYFYGKVEEIIDIIEMIIAEEKWTIVEEKKLAVEEKKLVVEEKKPVKKPVVKEKKPVIVVKSDFQIKKEETEKRISEIEIRNAKMWWKYAYKTKIKIAGNNGYIYIGKHNDISKTDIENVYKIGITKNVCGRELTGNMKIIYKKEVKVENMRVIEKEVHTRLKENKLNMPGHLIGKTEYFYVTKEMIIETIEHVVLKYSG